MNANRAVVGPLWPGVLGGESRFLPRFQCHPRRRMRPWKAVQNEKEIWIYARSKESVTSALESGLQKILLAEDEVGSATGVTEGISDWSALGKFSKYIIRDNGDIVDGNNNAVVGIWCRVMCADDVAAVENMACKGHQFVVIEATDWSIIPAENLIAAYQKVDSKLMTAVTSVEEAKLMLEVLETGTDGIVYDAAPTKGAGDMKGLISMLESLYATDMVTYQSAVVKRVVPVGSGDRACVDLCENMMPGEGILVGSFARGLFLVHSECEETSYINSRPFRVNAGPVHSYVQMPNNKTKYLSELRTGDTVEVYDAQGGSRSAIVGRVKIEKRPLLLIDVESKESGFVHSILLQNAETVKLVGPCSSEKGWKSISVSTLTEGSQIFILERASAAARHTGVLIEEKIQEV